MIAETILEVDFDGPPIRVQVQDGNFMDNDYVQISTNVSEDVILHVTSEGLVLEATTSLGVTKLILATPQDLGLE